MADEDELDAFFDEVEEVAEQVVKETENCSEVEQPTTKKPKIVRGVVVAAASAATSNVTVNQPIASPNPPPTEVPPPPPPAKTTLPIPPPPGPKKPHIRQAAGKTWEDHKLADWPDNDFRLFVGNLGNEVSDDMLLEHFQKYTSTQRAAIIREPSGKSKGYGFVSFSDPLQFAKALREMEQTWLGARPIRVKRSNWKEREVNKQKNKRNR
ncbi:hypothetical protein FisN_10Hu237 [Fistulifera solaris]|uniref:RRM domain-containing protein n=1 Tax=Fistulifera solaris TaxID=1519565 RepID=A0A1Z5JXH5_FISSO|nr:hypothetical protein FisN_10Hu237 [Fistulifera solaris]|eukprot:GAX18562.1 hypothetical protein FisN_10Hu237 [Fistulifera solaris]